MIHTHGYDQSPDKDIEPIKRFLLIFIIDFTQLKTIKKLTVRFGEGVDERKCN